MCIYITNCRGVKTRRGYSTYSRVSDFNLKIYVPVMVIVVVGEDGGGGDGDGVVVKA